MIDLSKPCESFDQACAEVVELAVNMPDHRRGYTRDVELPYFQGLIPMHTRWVRWLCSDPDDMSIFDFTDVSESAELMSPYLCGLGTLDVSFMHRFEMRGVDGVSFTRVRTRAISDEIRRTTFPANGLLEKKNHFRSQVIEISSLNVGGDNKFSSDRDYIGVHNRRLCLLNRRRVQRKGPELAGKIDVEHISLAASLDLTLRYEWVVRFGVDGSFSVAYPSERSNITDVFRLRDVPEGKRRREALQTLVTQHWKRSRSQAPTEDPRVFVREHLRGQTKFNWNGLMCEVIPPKYDVERLEKAKQA